MLEDFISELGLSTEDIGKIKEATDKEQILPFIENFRQTQKAIVLSDPTIEEGYEKKYSGMAIGKEKQLKKDLAKLANLTLTNDEVEKTKYSDLVSMALQAKPSEAAEVLELKNKYNTLMDSLEVAKKEKEDAVLEVQNRYKNKEKETEIMSALEDYIPSLLPKLPITGLKKMVRAYKTLLSADGIEIALNDKNALELQKDGLRYVKNGKPVHLSEDIKAFYEELTGNIYTKKPDEKQDFSKNPVAQNVSDKNKKALEMMGL